MTDRLIGIDFGLSKVGLSISDPLKIISIPLKVIKYKKREELLSKLQEIAMENDVKSFVIGYPLNMNNKKNEMTKLVDDFFEELKNLNFNVFLQDERLSSESAKKIMDLILHSSIVNQSFYILIKNPGAKNKKKKNS